MQRIFADFAFGPGPRTGCWWDETVLAPDWPVLEGERAVFTGGSVALLPDQVRRVRERNVTLKLGIRPRYLGVAATPGEGTVAARVTDVEDLGTHRLVTLRLGDGGGELHAMVHEDAEVPAEMAYLSFPPDRTKLFADDLLVA